VALIQSPHPELLPQKRSREKSGVDVMITIFCDFRQFLAKMAFFSINNVMIKILNNFSFVLSQKRKMFAEFFGANI
jgi:hypothetical protein